MGLDTRRVRIIDVTHLFYKYAFGGKANLTTTLMIDGIPTLVDTTIPTLTIKQLYRWADGGYNPFVVCFDGKGCSRGRKAYFAYGKAAQQSGETVTYKATRDSQNDMFYKSINMTMQFLIDGGVTCLKADNYEADDLIKAAVDRAKIDYPNMPIDIITGDQDLLPLVDEQVSVYMASKKLTMAESEGLELRHYVQVTPRNYEKFVSGLTDFKTLSVPYNTVLLKKLLRGKKADDIAGYPKFTPTKYNTLIANMIADGVDIGNLFRYDAPTKTILRQDNQLPVSMEEFNACPVENRKHIYMTKFGEPPKLTEMCKVLSKYLDEATIKHIRFIYNGVNLNGAFAGDLPVGFQRRPCSLSKPITGFMGGQLQASVSKLQIRLPQVDINY